MAKQVDGFCDSFEGFETFIKEVAVSLKTVLSNQTVILDNQNAMKQELFVLRNSQAEVSKARSTTPTSAPSSSTPVAAEQEPSPPSQSRTPSRPSLPPSRPSQPPMTSSPPLPRSSPPANKMLLVGDSISGQLHLQTIEFATKTKIRTARAYSSVHENMNHRGKNAPRFPTKNFSDVIANELEKEEVDVLVVQAGSVDITNLKTEGADGHNTEYFKQQAVESANNLFLAVSNAASKHTYLKKIIIMKQTPRYDFFSSTIPGLKPYLSKLYNDTLDQLGSSCTFRKKLIIGTHDLQARYKDSKSGRFDAIHLFGPSGQKSYTASVLKIMSSAQLVKTTPPKYYDEFYPRTRSQNKQKINAQTKTNNQNSRQDTRNKGNHTSQYTV